MISASGVTGRRSASSISNSRTSRASTSTASVSANCAPMQARGPAPNGRYENRRGVRHPAETVPERTDRGRATASCGDAAPKGRSGPRRGPGIAMPAALSRARAWRMIENAGGYNRSASSTTARVYGSFDTALPAPARLGPPGRDRLRPPRPRCAVAPPAHARGCKGTRTARRRSFRAPPPASSPIVRRGRDRMGKLPASCRTDRAADPGSARPAVSSRMRPICAIQRRRNRRRREPARAREPAGQQKIEQRRPPGPSA